MNKVLSTALMALCTCTPAIASIPIETEAEMAATYPINIIVKGKQAHITGAQGMTLQIYNLTGTCIANKQIDSMDTTFQLQLPKGCYILKIGLIVRKVSLT